MNIKILEFSVEKEHKISIFYSKLKRKSILNGFIETNIDKEFSYKKFMNGFPSECHSLYAESNEKMVVGIINFVFKTFTYKEKNEEICFLFGFHDILQSKDLGILFLKRILKIIDERKKDISRIFFMSKYEENNPSLEQFKSIGFKPTSSFLSLTQSFDELLPIFKKFEEVQKKPFHFKIIHSKEKIIDLIKDQNFCSIDKLAFSQNYLGFFYKIDEKKETFIGINGWKESGYNKAHISKLFFPIAYYFNPKITLLIMIIFFLLFWIIYSSFRDTNIVLLVLVLGILMSLGILFLKTKKILSDLRKPTLILFSPFFSENMNEQLKKKYFYP